MAATGTSPGRCSPPCPGCPRPTAPSRGPLDLIAGRIRALGHRAPASHAEFARLSRIADDGAIIEAGDWKDLVTGLVLGKEPGARTARRVFEAASATSDQPTADLLTQRPNVHEKNAGLLRSLLA